MSQLSLTVPVQQGTFTRLVFPRGEPMWLVVCIGNLQCSFRLDCV